MGLGYVGATTAACLLNDGHHVYGIDINPAKVEMIGAGRSPVVEPEVAELLACRDRGRTTPERAEPEPLGSIDSIS